MELVINDFVKETLKKFKSWTQGLGISLIITLGFFLVSIPGHSTDLWGVVFQISLSYGLIIYSMIWLTFLAIESWLDWREERGESPIPFGFKLRLLTSVIGLTIGAFLSEFAKAQILGQAVNFKNVPLVILIGIFISLMFIYQNLNREKEVENKTLEQLNQKLQKLKEQNYLQRITVSLGGTKKVLNVEDIVYFTSLDHYTHAYTQDNEYIVDLSLKKLTEELNPQQFLQIHRSTIVQLKYIDSIENGQQWFVRTSQGQRLSVSRKNRRLLKESL